MFHIYFFYFDYQLVMLSNTSVKITILWIIYNR